MTKRERNVTNGKLWGSVLTAVVLTLIGGVCFLCIVPATRAQATRERELAAETETATTETGMLIEQQAWTVMESPQVAEPEEPVAEQVEAAPVTPTAIPATPMVVVVAEPAETPEPEPEIVVEVATPEPAAAEPEVQVATPEPAAAEPVVEVAEPEETVAEAEPEDTVVEFYDATMNRLYVDATAELVDLEQLREGYGSDVVFYDYESQAELEF